MSYSIRLLSIRNRKNLEQYPIDYTKDIFKKYTNKLNYDRHLFVEKEGVNIYYTYLRRLSAINFDYFGFCFVFTGEYIEDIKGLFEICEELISLTLKQGELLNGSLPLSLERINDFKTKSPEIKRTEEWFNNLVSNKENFIIPFIGAVAGNSSTELSLKTDNDIILFNIKHYNHINYYINDLQQKNQEQLTCSEDTTTDTPKTEKEKNNSYSLIIIGVIIFILFFVLVN